MIPLAVVAFSAPALLNITPPPSSTLINQVAAFIGWGAFLACVAHAFGSNCRITFASVGAWTAAFGLLALAAIASPVWTGLPWSIAISVVGMIAAAVYAMLVGAAVQRHGIAESVFKAFCIGLVITGVACSLISLIQVFIPNGADGRWITKPYLPGRAVGNIRQPNHLSSLMLWATVAAVFLVEARSTRRSLGLMLAGAFVFVVVLTGSRTGALSMLVLAGWGAVDRRLPTASRRFLVLTPPLYAAFWYAMSMWAELGGSAFGGGARFKLQGDFSSSRFAIWSNVIELIRLHPWIGVGLGEFNFAWTLTPFANRPAEFFDHSHNLILHFVVELGVPLAILVCALLLAGLYQALQQARKPDFEPDPIQVPLRRAAFIMVLLILTHSLLEYPLWYAYFLLPAAFAYGLCAGAARSVTVGREASPSVTSGDGFVTPTKARGSKPLFLLAFLLIAGGISLLGDYARVIAVFAQSDLEMPLDYRINVARRSLFFSHFADYAAATNADRPGESLGPFASAPHYILDAPLLQAWAQSLNAAGDVERARYVADRLREFGNGHSAAFFSACTEPSAPSHPPLFQCVAATRPLRFEDFR